MPKITKHHFNCVLSDMKKLLLQIFCLLAPYALLFAIDTSELKKRAEQGDSEAQHDLAVRYSIGKEIEKDPKRAFELWKISAEQGLAQSQYALAFC